MQVRTMEIHLAKQVLQVRRIDTPGTGVMQNALFGKSSAATIVSSID